MMMQSSLITNETQIQSFNSYCCQNVLVVLYKYKVKVMVVIEGSSRPPLETKTACQD